MKQPGLRRALLIAGTLIVLLALGSPWIVAEYWRVRSSNPVRRGVALARELGCFSCHGNLGGAGIPDPGNAQGVPQWNGSVWMMFVPTEDDVRRYIREGSRPKAERAADESGPVPGPIAMPAYGKRIGGGDLDDLVAMFKVVSGMVAPARETPARSGYDLAREWSCFACHGPGGCGGRANPGSFTGFIPGWYGADFDDLVRDRREFDGWVRDGTLPRIASHPVASFFLERQRISMPAYRGLSAKQLDDLWAYVQWLRATDGGQRGEIQSW